MIRQSICFFSLLIQLLPFISYSQCGTDIPGNILKNQKSYYSKISTQNKKFYVSIISLAGWIRPKVFYKIDSLDKKFDLATTINLNIVEGYDFAHGNIYGLMWSDTNYYRYINNPARIAGSDLSVRKVSFSQLTDEEKDIVLHFDNWNNSIFRSINNSSRFVNPPLYYIGSEVARNCKIKTIAFCY
jgi:hypothetical protein